MTHRPRILYFGHATEATYALIRAAVPEGFELVTLDRDGDAERREKLADCEVVIVAAQPFRRPMIEAAPRLRLVQHQGVGYHDTVDLAALAERGIALAVTTVGTAAAAAEHAIMLMLAVCRRLTFLDAELRQGRWHVNSMRAEARELNGMTIGYLGMGRIGQATAERLRAFGTTGLYADARDRDLPAGRAAALGLVRVPFDTLLQRADIVTLHLPLTAETRRTMDARAIARMKPGAMLVNTARGGLVDEAALAAALAAGRLGGAGLDVFDREPVETSPLLALPNVVLTPHVAAATREAFTLKLAALFENIRRFYAGEPLRDRIEPC